MNAYHALAASYDRLTNDVDYAGVVEFYEEILRCEDLVPKTAVDLACGTGSVAALLAEKGLQVIGVDMSEDMLTVAYDKTAQMDNPPYFVCQRLEKLRLPEKVDLAVCALDSINYILKPSDCEKALSRVFQALKPGGIFIFDVNTPFKLRAMDGQIFLDEDEDVFCLWRGEFDEDSNILTYAMDLFQRNGELWERSFEEHQEYAYTQEQLVGFLEKAGFVDICVYADRKMNPPTQQELRIYLKARKGIVK